MRLPKKIISVCSEHAVEEGVWRERLSETGMGVTYVRWKINYKRMKRFWI